MIQIENDLLVAALETGFDDRPNTCLVTDTTALLEETDVEEVAQVAEDKDSKKGRAVPTLQEFLHPYTTDAF